MLTKDWEQDKSCCKTWGNRGSGFWGLTPTSAAVLSLGGVGGSHSVLVGDFLFAESAFANSKGVEWLFPDFWHGNHLVIFSKLKSVPAPLPVTQTLPFSPVC